jgi:arylsulfatase A-like enzyme
MKFKSLVSVVFFLLASIVVFAQEKKPNIVMIAIDDLNDWIGVYGGNPQVKTPNIDRLAKSSVVFRNASCPGPVCGPSRSALLSGFMPGTTGVYSNSTNMLNSDIVKTHATLPEYFSKNGYYTLSSGKIFHKHTTANGDDNGQWAYDEWEENAKGASSAPQEDKLYSCYKGIINGKKIDNPQFQDGPANDMLFAPTIVTKEKTKDYMTAKWAEKKLQQDFDKPFFMSVGISKPHLPFIVPEEFFDLYGLDTLKLPQYQMNDLDDIVDSNGKMGYKPHTSFLWAKHYGVEKEVMRAYMAAISYADACVGVILDAIEKSNYADNTIIILWGDHGWHLGEKLRYGKATLWKEATQLPFIFHTPNMKIKQECFRNVNLIDIYPTLIDLCQLPTKKLDGKSLVPLFKNPKEKWTPTVTTLNQGNHSIMSEKWHYISTQKGVNELYNLEKDPMEWTNLVNSNTPEINKVIQEMKTYLPKINAVEITRDSGEGDTDKKSKNKKGVDLTIKSKRVLQDLK